MHAQHTNNPLVYRKQPVLGEVGQIRSAHANGVGGRGCESWNVPLSVANSVLLVQGDPDVVLRILERVHPSGEAGPLRDDVLHVLDVLRSDRM